MKKAGLILPLILCLFLCPVAAHAYTLQFSDGAIYLYSASNAPVLLKISGKLSGVKYEDLDTCSDLSSGPFTVWSTRNIEGKGGLQRIEQSVKCSGDSSDPYIFLCTADPNAIAQYEFKIIEYSMGDCKNGCLKETIAIGADDYDIDDPQSIYDTLSGVSLAFKACDSDYSASKIRFELGTSLTIKIEPPKENKEGEKKDPTPPADNSGDPKIAENQTPDVGPDQGSGSDVYINDSKNYGDDQGGFCTLMMGSSGSPSLLLLFLISPFILAVIRKQF